MKKKKTCLLSTTNLLLFKSGQSLHKYNHKLELVNNNLIIINEMRNSIDSESFLSHGQTSGQTHRTKFNYSNLVISSLLLILIELLSKPSLVLANSLHVTSNNNKLAPLYWVTNNKKFYESTSDSYYLKLNAHIGESIDLVCPKMQKNINNESTNHHNANSSIDSTEQNQAHYLTIYKVGSKYEFDNCIVNPNNIETVPILKCDKPAINTKFTIYFVKFSPVPFALEFEEDKEYFFLSTSSGSKDGLNFMTGGLCSKFNMRFSIKISSTTSEPTPSTNNASLAKKHEHHQNSASSSSSLSSQLLSEEDSIILQQLRERIQSTVSSMNHLINRNDKSKETPPQASKSSNLVLISKSNNLFANNFYIYSLLVIYIFLLRRFFV